MIVLVRHGSTDANAAGSFLSTGDPPLNDAGRAQCDRAREAVARAGVTACLVSPMRRCLQSLAILAPGVSYEVRDELREIDFGDWEGRTIDELRVEQPEAVDARRRDPVHFKPPAGESFADVAERLAPLARTMRARSGLLIVSHRGTLGVLERLLRELPLDSPDVTPMEPGEVRTLRA